MKSYRRKETIDNIIFFFTFTNGKFLPYQLLPEQKKWLLVEMTLEKDWNDHQERSSACSADVCSIFHQKTMCLLSNQPFCSNFQSNHIIIKAGESNFKLGRLSIDFLYDSLIKVMYSKTLQICGFGLGAKLLQASGFKTEFQDTQILHVIYTDFT